MRERERASRLYYSPFSFCTRTTLFSVREFYLITLRSKVSRSGVNDGTVDVSGAAKESEQRNDAICSQVRIQGWKPCPSVVVVVVYRISVGPLYSLCVRVREPFPLFLACVPSRPSPFTPVPRRSLFISVSGAPLPTVLSLSLSLSLARSTKAATALWSDSNVHQPS